MDEAQLLWEGSVMYTKVYPKPVVGYLSVSPSVKNPVKRHTRILIYDYHEDVRGDIVEATIRMKGQDLRFENGKVVDKGETLMKGMRVSLSDAQRHKDYVEGQCRMACDPSTETYWSL
jgi:hypothetical protein